MKIFKEAQIGTQQPSLFYDVWAEGHDLKDEEGKPRKLYHGTHSEFDEFQFGNNTENWFGNRAIYTSTSPKDVEKNYSNIKGPDVQRKIEIRADQLIDQAKEDPEYASQLGIDPVSMDWSEMVRLLKPKIMQDLNMQAPRTLALYGKMKNPAYILPGRPPSYSMYPEDEDTLEATSDIIWQNMIDLAYDYNLDEDEIDQFLEDVREKLPDEFNLYDLDKAIRKTDGFFMMHDDDGLNIGGSFMKELIEALGHDGIIMDASGTFKGMEMPPNVQHHIFFRPDQLKSAIGNTGIYDPQSAVLTASTKIFKMASKKRYYHASPKLFSPGDYITPQDKGKFNYSQPGLIYLTESPKPHYTIADVANREGWYVYEVRPTNLKRIWVGKMWDEYQTDRPCEVIKRVGNARGISKAGQPPKNKGQKAQEEWNREKLIEAKEAINDAEKRKEFEEFWEMTPENAIKKWSDDIKYKNPDTSKAIYKFRPYKGLEGLKSKKPEDKRSKYQQRFDDEEY